MNVQMFYKKLLVEYGDCNQETIQDFDLSVTMVGGNVHFFVCVKWWSDHVALLCHLYNMLLKLYNMLLDLTWCTHL